MSADTGEWKALVICDEPSHERHVAKIAAFYRLDAELDTYTVIGVPGDEDTTLTYDKPTDPNNLLEHLNLAVSPEDAPEDQLGQVDEALMDAIRSRNALTCDLCGLRVEMRQETIQRIGRGLHGAGVARLSLRSLAAIL